MRKSYPVDVKWSEEDQEYCATIAAFPGLSAFGRTREEALREAQIALHGFVDTYTAQGMPLPEVSDADTNR